MRASRSLLFCFLYSCLLGLSRLESFVDIRRSTDGDIFSNPASSDDCDETARKSCDVYDNVERGGKCISLENCCQDCRCSDDKATYLRHEKRCISNENLTAALFRDQNQGCSFRLVPNSYHDNIPRGRQPCLFKYLRLHALNTTVSGSQKIDVCGIFSWSISSCRVLSGAYYKNGRWTDLWGVGSVEQDVFSIEKRQGVDIFLKWNDTLPSTFLGDILSLDIKCYRKFDRGPVESCLLFKVRGSQMDVRPSTLPPTNFTGTPTNIGSRGKQKLSDTTIIIIISVICALIFLVLLCVVILCIRRRGGMCTKKKYCREKRERKLELHPKPGKHLTILSPPTKNEMGEYRHADQTESPVYTTPGKNSKTDKTAEYQNLLQAIASTPHYHPLLAKDDKEAPRPSSPPYYHEPEKPGNKPPVKDNLPHFYHVLEGP